MAEKPSITDILTAQKSLKEDNGDQIPIGDFETLNRDDIKHLTTYGGTVKIL